MPSESIDGGQRFCLFHEALDRPPRGLILYVHPFAEEMNKSRRMAAIQARAFAEAGYDVLQIDLLGCGDSSGDFGDASWQAWVADVVQGCRWLRHRSNMAGAASDLPPLWLWGLRAGCLLAVEAASQLGAPCHFIFWQPPVSGKPLLQQFLRLKVAGDMLGGQAKGAMESLRLQLAAGEAVEIAGYTLSAALAAGLERAQLVSPGESGRFGRMEWFELSTRDDADMSPISAKTFALWQNNAMTSRSHVVNGPAFWQTSEIEDAPALVLATIAAVNEMAHV